MVAILREADRTPVSEIVRKHKLGEQTHYVQRNRFGTREPADMKRLCQLEIDTMKEEINQRK